jgi:hypothetical protein
MNDRVSEIRKGNLKRRSEWIYLTIRNINDRITNTIYEIVIITGIKAKFDWGLLNTWKYSAAKEIFGKINLNTRNHWQCFRWKRASDTISKEFSNDSRNTQGLAESREPISGSISRLLIIPQQKCANGPYSMWTIKCDLEVAKDKMERWEER